VARNASQGTVSPAEFPTETIDRPPPVGAASDSASDHRAFATELEARGDFAGAAGELLRSLALEPADTGARRRLAAAYEKLGENERAMLEYHKVLFSDPDNVEANVSLGKMLLAGGDTDEASQFLRHALHLNPESNDISAALDRAEKASMHR
jgi:Flp pilus assembly protein TadD